MLDYILNVAVGISAGVGALVSAVPSLHPHILALCLSILGLITVVNLRGVRESGVVLAFPTYIFLACMGSVLVLGLLRVATSGGSPIPRAPLPSPSATLVPASAWLLVRAFASGCTAMTGVEAVSNAVQAFRKPTVKNARLTLGALVLLLSLLLIGIATLTRAYGIVATSPDSPSYQSVLSQLAAAVVGRGWLYYVTIGSTLAILALSANTSFAGFPRLCRLLAQDDYLPHAFATVGRRLVYSIGIVFLAVVAGALLIVFGGITDRLIPLFAVGALLAFTMSQWGMVKHYGLMTDRRGKGKRSVNLVGAVTTGAALAVVLAAKFTDGAWITLVLIGGMIWLFLRVKRHYRFIERLTHAGEPLDVENLHAPVAIVPLTAWSKVTAKALRFALTMSDDVRALHISIDEEEERKVCAEWRRHVELPLAGTDRAVPRLDTIRSPYRRLSGPLLTFLLRTQHDHPEQTVAVIIPELVEAKWYQFFLHNQKAAALKMALLLRGGSRVVVVSVPWYTDEPEEPR
ncbi:APC family permease [Fimbriimonas ginsengisoli]